MLRATIQAGFDLAQMTSARKPEQKVSLPTEKAGERIAKVMARAGLASRRDAEAWIAAGRVAVNGKTLTSPALNVTAHDRVVVDGNPLPQRERTRLFRYHKPPGLLTTNRDDRGRPTIFGALPRELPRLVTIGRLDLNSEGLLLLTNDGGLARVLELPDTGWLRRYRVRAHGRVDPAALDRLRNSITVDGVAYGPIEATLDREQGANVWITMGLREGKNREVRNVLRHLGLSVNRLIRVSYGPFQLGDLERAAIEEVNMRTLKEQLGERLARLAGSDFDAPLRETRQPKAREPKSHRARPAPAPGRASPSRPPSRKPEREKRRESAGNARATGDEMRIVGGKFRGRALKAPPPLRSGRPPTGCASRSSISWPTPMATRSAMPACSISSPAPARSASRRCRAARFTLFVEDAAEARALIRENVETFALPGVTRLFRRDATNLGEAKPVEPFDLVFCDPPYGHGFAEKALASARAGGWLVPGALIVVEEEKGAFATPEGFEEIERRAYDDAEIHVPACSGVISAARTVSRYRRA